MESVPRVLLGEYPIEACQAWNCTGLVLQAGHAYEFEVQPGQTWHDASIKTSARGYDSARWFFRLTARWRRAPDQNWFALIGAIDRQTTTQFLVGDGCSVEHWPTTGELCCFANDLRLMYWNNSGAIRLQVYERALAAGRR